MDPMYSSSSTIWPADDPMADVTSSGPYTHIVMQLPLHGCACRQCPQQQYILYPWECNPDTPLGRTMRRIDKEFYTTFPDALEAKMRELAGVQRCLHSSYDDSYYAESYPSEPLDHDASSSHYSAEFSPTSSTICSPYPACYEVPRIDSYGYVVSSESTFLAPPEAENYLAYHGSRPGLLERDAYCATQSDLRPFYGDEEPLPISTDSELECALPFAQHVVPSQSHHAYHTYEPASPSHYDPSEQLLPVPSHLIVPSQMDAEDAETMTCPSSSPAADQDHHFPDLLPNPEQARYSRSNDSGSGSSSPTFTQRESSAGKAPPHNRSSSSTSSSRPAHSSSRSRRNSSKLAVECPPENINYKKPLHLACFFCRGRKIACSSAPVDVEDKTCNQCAKRGIVCQYPLESRRGQRTKKNELPAVAEEEERKPVLVGRG